MSHHICSVQTIQTLLLGKISETLWHFIMWRNFTFCRTNFFYWVTSPQFTTAIVSCRCALLHSTGSSRFYYNLKLYNRTYCVAAHYGWYQITAFSANLIELRVWGKSSVTLYWVWWLIDWVRLNVPPTHYRSYGDGYDGVEQLCATWQPSVLLDSKWTGKLAIK